MDDLDLLLAEGKITASEYAKRSLEQQQSVQNRYETIELGQGQQKSLENNLGTDPNLLPDSGVQYQMNISPEEMETYTSRGITPNTYTDYVDQRAQLQTTADKWGNGVTKMLGKAATATVGGLGMLGSVAINVAGQFEDLWNNDDNTAFHEIYDNAFFTALDNANKEMDDALPHYVTKAREDDNLYESLGSANFWSNDFLQGASFVIGAIATEGLIGVASKGLGITSRMNNITKTLNSVENATASGASKLFGKSSILQSGKEATILARQMITSAGYESAVEANSFVQDAKAQWILDYQETHKDIFGRSPEPPAEELAKAMKEIYSVGNGVFGTNLIVTGLTQAKTLPGMFSPKLGKLLGSTDNIAKDAKKMVETATLTNKQLTRAAKRMKISVEELRKIPNIAKEVAYTKLGKFASRAGKGLEGALFEGGQEGLQKAISYSAMDYLNDRFDGAHAEDIVKSGIAGLSKAFGNNAESWKEIFIGALLGSTGGPGGPKGARWQGGIVEAFRDPSKSPSFQKTLALANKYATNEKGFLNNYLKHVALSTNTQEKKDGAIERGDIYDYKSEEAKEVFDYFNFMSKMGRLSEVEDKHLREMQNMTKEEFQNSYGYENLTEEKFIQRKAELAANIKNQIKDANYARSTAASIYRGGDPDVLDGIAYSIYANKNLDHRESTMAQEIAELLGKALPNNLRDVSDMPNLSEVIILKKTIANLENAKVDPVSDQARLDQLEKLNKQFDKLIADNYDKQQKVDKTNAATTKVDYKTSAEFAAYKASVMAQVDALNEIATSENLDPIEKADIEKKLEDLKKIANERKQYVGDFNRLLTRKGIDELENQVASLRQEYLDEEIDLRTNTILEARRKADPSEQIYKAQEEAFRLKAGNVNFALDIIGRMAETKEQLDEIDTIIQGLQLQDQEKLDVIKGWFTDFHKALAVYDTLPNEEAKKKYLQETLKGAITDLRFKMLNLKMTNPEDYEKLVASGMYKRLTTLIASLGVNPANTSTALTPVNSDPRQLQTMTWIPEDSPAYTPEVTAIRNNATDIEDHVSFKIVREDLIDADGNVKPDFVEPNNQVSEEMVGTGVKVAMCIPELKTMLNDTAPGVKYVVQVFYDNTHIGFLNTPNKYRFGDTMDEFNGSVEHLAMLNPRYVKTEDDGTVVASQEGKKFKSIYKNSVESFNKLLNQVKPATPADPVKLDFTNQEVKAIYDIHFDFSGMKKDSVGLSLQELANVANGNTVSKLDSILSAVPDGLPKEGIIIYNKFLLKYYVYDPITQESFEIPKGYNSELRDHFAQSLDKIEKYDFALTALYNINGKSLLTVLKDEEVDTPQFESVFTQELIEDLSDAADYLKELKDAYKLNDFFKTKEGKSTNLAQLPSKFRKYRFTSFGRNYTMGYVARKDSKGEPYIELQLSVYTGNAGLFTNVTLGVYNLNKQAIPFVQESKITANTQPFLYNNNAFLFTKDGLKHDGRVIKTSKDLIRSLNEKIDDELTRRKNEKEKNPTDKYLIAHVINLAYVDPGTGKAVPASIENVKVNISTQDIVSNLNRFKTVRTPDLKVTFTKPGGATGLTVDLLEASIQRALDATNAYSEIALLDAIQVLKDTFNSQNNTVQNNYRIKYNNALNHVNALINRRPPTATPTTITEGRFVAKLENGVWKIYDSLGESLGLSYNTKEAAILEMKLAVLAEKVGETISSEENYNNWSNIRDHSDDAQFEDAIDFVFKEVDLANQRTTNPLTANDIKSILDQHKVTKNINIQNIIIPLLMELQQLANPTSTTSTQAAPVIEPTTIKTKESILNKKEEKLANVKPVYHHTSVDPKDFNFNEFQRGNKQVSQFGDGLNASSNTTSFLVNRYGKAIQGEINNSDFVKIDASKTEKEVYEELKNQGYRFSEEHNTNDILAEVPGAAMDLFTDFQKSNPDVKGVQVNNHIIGDTKVAPFYVIYDAKSFYGQGSLTTKIEEEANAELAALAEAAPAAKETKAEIEARRDKDLLQEPITTDNGYEKTFNYGEENEYTIVGESLQDYYDKIIAKYNAELDALNNPTTKAQTPAAEEAKGDNYYISGYGDIAADYLFTGGKGVILSTDYLLQALTASFPYSGRVIDNIRNRDANKLGFIKDDIGKDAYNNAIQEIKDEINKTYNSEKANELLNKILDNATGFTLSRVGNQVSSELDVLNAELDALNKPTTEAQAPVAEEGGLDAYSTSELLSKEYEEIAEKQSRLLDLLPDWVTVRDIETVKEGLSKSGFTYGMFKNAAIYLARNAPKGTEYHEAFHAVMRVLLTDNQIIKILEEAKTRYGKPTKEQLNDLRGKSGKYSKLTVEQLVNLWYEEQMADDFMDYMNNKKEIESTSFIKRMFDKIIKAIKGLFGNTDGSGVTGSVIDELFKDISEGKFKKAPKVKQSIIPLDVEAFKLLKNNDNSFMNLESTNNIMNSVFFEALNFKNENGFLTGDEIDSIIDSIREEVHAPSNFIGMLNKVAETNPSEALKVRDNIQSMYDSMNSEANKKEIIEVILNMVSLYKFTDFDIDVDMQDDKGINLIQKSNQTVGGMDSVGNKLKQYIMFTPTISDKYGFRLSKEELEALVSDENVPLSLRKAFVNYVDGYKLHNSMERMLVNTKREDLLNKLYNLTNENVDLNAFYTRLVVDIYNDLKIELPDNYKKDILDIPITALAKSTHFRMFAAGYNKHKVNSIINRVDKKTGMSKLHRSNLNDVQDNQLKIWYNDFRSSNFMNMSKEEIKKALGDASAALAMANPAQFQAKFEIIKRIMKDVYKINLSDNYIKLSLFHNNAELFQNVEEGSELEAIKKLYESYKDIEYLNEETLIAINASIRFNENDQVITHHFTKSKEELEKDRAEGVEDSELDVSNLGAVSGIKKLAFGNSMFDTSASPSTFTNVNNEKVYNHLYPNYLTTFALAVRNSMAKTNFDFIDAYDYNEGFESFKKFMFENNLASPLEDDLVLNIYYRQLRNNPILNNKNIREAFVNNFECFINDGLKSQSFDATFKGIEFADSYASLDSRAKVLFNLNQFANQEENSIDKDVKNNNNGEITDVRLYPITWVENGGKSTQWSALVPDLSYINDLGLLNEAAITSYTALLKSELERVKEEFQNIINGEGVVDGYNTISTVDMSADNYEKLVETLKNPASEEEFMKAISKFRALKLANFEVIKDINADLYKSLIINAINGDTKFDGKAIAELVSDYHFTEFIEFLKSPDIRVISNQENMLPAYYTKDGGPDMNLLKQFFLNYFINAASLNNLLVGDLNANYKSPTDLFKRMAGLAAAGPSQGFGESNIAIVDDIIIDGIKTTDGQSEATIWWYMNQYLPTGGKWNTEIERIYTKILKLEELTADEVTILQDTGTMLNPRKTSGYTFNFYGKTSTAVITRKETSYVSEKDKEEFEREVVKLLPSSGLIYGTEAFQEQVLLVQSFYKPRRATEELHNRLNKMEQSNVDLLFYKSAVKTLKADIQNVNAARYSRMRINNEFIREQVVTDSVKNEVIHGTQLMQLIWSEQNDAVVVKFNGEDVTIGELRKSYKNLLGWRVSEGFEQLQKAILKNDKANYKILLKSFQQSIIEQGADPTLLELFNSLGEIPEYNLNNPRTLGMFEKMFMSFVSKSVFSRKTAGHKFTLRTDFGHNVLRRDDSVELKRDFGSVVSNQDYDANPEAYKNTKVDRLRILTDPKNPNIKYAECKIPIQLASMLEIDENGFLTSEAAEMLGIRIPSQDKHSMLYLKVVEVLPAELGPQIIMPREVIALSGADFDIDSEFARALEHFMSNGKIISFGGYLTSDNPVGIAYGEYLESKYNSKEVKIQADYLLKDNLEYQELLKDYERAKGQLKKTDKKDKKAYAENKETRDNVKALVKSYRDAANENALKYFGYPSNFTEFSDRYSGQILNNVKNFKEQKISQITPLTMEEANNHLLNIEKTFVNNVGNGSIAMTPASDTAARTFMSKFYDTIEDPLSAVDYATPQAVIRGSNANAIGQENIGIAALANIMFQYFKDNNIEIKGLGTVNSFKAENGNRINDSVSTVVTMAVDNANEQYAIRFNLTPATQSVFVSMLMLQNNFDYVSALMVQPALVEFAAMEAFKKSPIKNKIEEGEENIGSLALLKGEYETLLVAAADGAKEISYEDLFPQGIDYEILKKAKLYDQKVKNGQTLTADDLTLNQYRAVQAFALSEFEKYKNQTDSLFHFSRVLSLIKGLKPSVGDVITTQESLKRLGLEVKNNTIVHTDEYKESLEDPDNNDFPIDYLKIFNGNSFLKAEVLTYTRFLNVLPKFFVSRTPLALSLYDDVANNIKYMKVEDSEKLTRLINGYLTTMSFKNKHDKESKFINFNDLISDENTDSLLVDLLKKLKKSDDPLISRNEFIRFLDYDKVTYEKKKNNSLNGKTTYTLKIDSFAKLTPNQARDLSNSFAQLYTSTDPLAREFARKIIYHVLGKDLGMYKNNSYLSFIPPNILKSYINQINDMHEELLKPTPNYKAVFNMTKEELLEDFTEKYIRDINNTMSIKGGRRIVIGRLTKDAMHTVYWKLSAADKMLIEADPELAPIIKKIKEKTKFNEEDYLKICPLVFNKEGNEFEINIFNNFFTTDADNASKLKNPAIVRFNKAVLKKVGLFGYEIVEKDGKYYSNILFPKGLNILYDDGKKLFYRTELTTGKGLVSSNPNAGVKAVYKQVTTLGSKLVLPYAFSISDQLKEAIKAGAVTPAVPTSVPGTTAAPVINTAKPGLQRGTAPTQVVPQQVPQQASGVGSPVNYINIDDKLLKEIYTAKKSELEKIKKDGVREINDFEQFKEYVNKNVRLMKGLFNKSDEEVNLPLNALFKTANYIPGAVAPAPAAPTASNDIAEKARLYRSKMHYLTVAEKLKGDGISSYEEYLKWANTVADDKLVFATENC